MGLRGTALLLLLVTLAGCGFHLRGAESLPEEMARTYIEAPAGSPLRYELEELLLAAGGEVAQDEGSASAVLQVHSAVVRSRTLSLDELGRVREYGLTLMVKYALVRGDGEGLGEAITSRVERAFRVDPDNVLAKGNERELVEQEMYRTAAQLMLRRLRSAAASAPAAPPVPEGPAAGQ